MWWCVDEAFESYVDVETGVDAEVHVDVEVDVDAVTAAVPVLVAAEVLVRAVSDYVDVGVGAHAHAPAHAHVDVGIGIDTGVDVAVVLHDDARARCAVHVGPPLRDGCNWPLPSSQFDVILAQCLQRVVAQYSRVPDPREKHEWIVAVERTIASVFGAFNPHIAVALSL